MAIEWSKKYWAQTSIMKLYQLTVTLGEHPISFAASVTRSYSVEEMLVINARRMRTRVT